MYVYEDVHVCTCILIDKELLCTEKEHQSWPHKQCRYAHICTCISDSWGIPVNIVSDKLVTHRVCVRGWQLVTHRVCVRGWLAASDSQSVCEGLAGS